MAYSMQSSRSGMDADRGEYIKDLRLYQRKFGFLATSVDLKLKIILAKMELDPPKTLQEKISMFLKALDIDGSLAEKLLEFSRYWKALDQGSEAPNAEPLAVSFEGKVLAFGRARQVEIDADFIDIMAALTEISDNLD
jgi:hypothetical protein